ncbi:MAG: OB-fold domain-containing protein [Dehalococcoidia bacterium]|nr:OB-fold domain-containing protein [Dehalococcoidia bacterium]
MPKPVPLPDAVTKPFWDAANERRLVAQFCLGCNRYQHPPQEKCAKCDGGDLEFRQLSGRGTIYSWQIMHDTRVRLMQEYQPMVIAVVESEESPDVWLLTNLPGSEQGQFDIGDPVEVEFEEVAPGTFIPQFRLAGGPNDQESK